MAAWTSDELAKIGTADELRLAVQGAGGTMGKARPVWVVRHGDDLYSRSVNGPSGVWYRGVMASRAGHVDSGGVSKDVTFANPDPGIENDLDAAYRAKYHRYATNIVDSIVSPQARSAAVKLVSDG
jgi:hypothetical protein